MELKEALEYFEMSLYNKNLAESSIAHYKKNVEYMIDFLDGLNIKTLGEVRSFHLERYFAYLTKNGNRAATKKNKRSIVMNYFQYCLSQKFIEEDPSTALQVIKQTDEDRKKRETLSTKETYRLIASVEKNSRNVKKNLAIVKIFAFCGVRVSELCKLEWDDIDWKKKRINVRGKGRKERRVPLFPDVEKDLREYKKIQKGSKKYIFNSKNSDKPVTERAIYHLINTHAKKARIRKRVGPHTLRRTSATNYLREEVNIKYIQRLLGHASISTTSMYLDPDDDDVNKELNNALRSMKRKA